MPYKDDEKQRESKKRYYEQNKEVYKQRDRERKQRIRQWYRDYKMSCSCEECGESRWQCLDYHHKDAEDKLFCINHMVKHRFGIPKILEELAKCICLCANCHRCHHHGNVWSDNHETPKTEIDATGT